MAAFPKALIETLENVGAVPPLARVLKSLGGVPAPESGRAANLSLLAERRLREPPWLMAEARPDRWSPEDGRHKNDDE